MHNGHVGNRLPEFSPENYNFDPQTNALERASERLNEEQSTYNPDRDAKMGNAAMNIPIMPPEPEDVVGDGLSTESKSVFESPSVAQDGNKLEKEWVEKVNKIIHEDRNDPHKLLLDTAKMRESYLEKRWGRILGARN